MTLDRTATSEQLTRLRGIADQVHSIAAMVEQEQYGIDVLTRVSAVCPGLQWEALALLDEQMSRCAAAWDPGEWQ